MLFQFNQFSSLLLIFFVHGLVYALLLFRKGNMRETRSDKWLGLFLLLCILYISPWMLGFAGWYDNQPYRDILFYTPFQQLFFIGPVIFFYIQSLLNPAFRFGKRDFWHLLPGILYLLFSFVMLVTDKVILQQYYFLANGLDPDFDTWYQLAGYLSMLLYFVASLRYYLLYRRMIVQVISYADRVMFRWVRNFLIAFLGMLALRMVFYIASFFIEGDYQETWWYYLFFAVIYYYIAITGYANAVENRIAFRPNLLRHHTALLLTAGPDKPEAGQTEEAIIVEIETVPATDKAEEAAIAVWKDKIWTLLQLEKLYQDPELSLSELAKRLQTNPGFISRVVNRGYGVNFNDFINQFRIDAVKEMIARGEHQRQTLLGIAYDCGFNSKATFNRAFKKATGQTPKEFIASADRS